MKVVVAILLCVAHIPDAESSVFCEGLGTFEPTGPFVNWPNPTCPGDNFLTLTFDMYSRDSGEGVSYSFDRHTVPVNFDRALDTIFLVHGYTWNDPNLAWMERIANTLVRERFVNVALVRWTGSSGSFSDDYSIAASTTRTVGAEAAYVMDTLIETGNSFADMMWCVGHGLGAHVCGHLGRQLKVFNRVLEHATGLNPAGEMFINNPDRDVGLYRDVADYVDIVHTDRVLGSVPEPLEHDIPLGHQDFYVNLGTDQPGCNNDALCNHRRAYELWEDTITSTCQEGYEADRECVNVGNIPDSCIICLTCPTMGYFAQDTERGAYLVSADNPDPPYVC